ncbi:hypothetical protein PoB_007234500 [Plakobranchus ocellatus]|uniref:Ig-like domain-containing protein n=1 Tax=Plakobranchus ocellatus TaxID=259542 RepID=A0AAV4DP57_9GAST|nr:hypothetical protein PoB_007234500 [Plakobranchus ocellatus]
MMILTLASLLLTVCNIPRSQAQGQLQWGFPPLQVVGGKIRFECNASLLRNTYPTYRRVHLIKIYTGNSPILWLEYRPSTNVRGHRATSRNWTHVFVNNGKQKAQDNRDLVSLIFYNNDVKCFDAKLDFRCEVTVEEMSTHRRYTYKNSQQIAVVEHPNPVNLESQPMGAPAYVEALEGTQVKLMCSFNGTLIMGVLWMRYIPGFDEQRRTVPVTTQISDTQLTLNYATCGKPDYYLSCKAQYAQVSEDQIARLQLFIRPQPPQTVQLRQVAGFDPFVGALQKNTKFENKFSHQGSVILRLGAQMVGSKNRDTMLLHWHIINSECVGLQTFVCAVWYYEPQTSQIQVKAAEKTTTFRCGIKAAKLQAYTIEGIQVLPDHARELQVLNGTCTFVGPEKVNWTITEGHTLILDQFTTVIKKPLRTASLKAFPKCVCYHHEANFLFQVPADLDGPDRTDIASCAIFVSGKVYKRVVYGLKEKEGFSHARLLALGILITLVLIFITIVYKVITRRHSPEEDDYQ